jgi:hypothetical protein
MDGRLMISGILCWSSFHTSVAAITRVGAAEPAKITQISHVYSATQTHTNRKVVIDCSYHFMMTGYMFPGIHKQTSITQRLFVY